MKRDEYKLFLEKVVLILRGGNVESLNSMIPNITKGIQKFILTEDIGDGKEIMLFVREFVESFKRRDYVLMADLIEYEFLPRIEKQEKCL